MSAQSPIPPPPRLKPPRPRTAYLVLGMHRSGTSAVTQLLALAGASLPAHVMPGDEHNAKGYFEPWKIAMFNDARLRAAGSAWDDPFAYPFRPLPPEEERLWQGRAGKLFDSEFRRTAWPLMKDPRATVLLPFWRNVLAERGVAARCVIPVRHPLAVAGSLKRRDGFAPEKSVLVWSAYMLAAEAYTRDLPRAFVSYDGLLSDWRGEVARMEAAHGAPLPRLTEAGGRQIDDFLTGDLRHNTGDDGLAALGWAGDIARDVLAWCEAEAAGTGPDRTGLDAAAARLQARAGEVGMLVSPTTRDLAEARGQLLESRDRLAEAKSVQAEIRAELAAAQAYAGRLETGWQADQERLRGALAVLAEVDAELDAALTDD